MFVCTCRKRISNRIAHYNFHGGVIYGAQKIRFDPRKLMDNLDNFILKGDKIKHS